MLTRDAILDLIRQIAADNGGRAPGMNRFQTETGIGGHQWAKYWARWSDAVRDAGLQPAVWVAKLTDDQLLGPIVRETRRLGRVPTGREMRVQRTIDGTVTASRTMEKYRRSELVKMLADYCRAHPEHGDVLAIVEATTVKRPMSAVGSRVGATPYGQVYLIRSGKHFKIGHTRAFARRMSQLDTALAEGRDVIHVIKSDDPPGIEDYWHRRFASRRRGDTEWFDLTPDDVAAFKRWKKIT